MGMLKLAAAPSRGHREIYAFQFAASLPSFLGLFVAAAMTIAASATSARGLDKVVRFHVETD